MTMTGSPGSRKGVYCGLFLPVSTRATSVARRPTVWPAASTTYHLRFSASPSPLGKYVDIDNSLKFKRLKRERVEYLTGFSLSSRRAGPSSLALFERLHPEDDDAPGPPHQHQ